MTLGGCAPWRSVPDAGSGVDGLVQTVQSDLAPLNQRERRRERSDERKQRSRTRAVEGREVRRAPVVSRKRLRAARRRWPRTATHAEGGVPEGLDHLAAPEAAESPAALARGAVGARRARGAGPKYASTWVRGWMPSPPRVARHKRSTSFRGARLAQYPLNLWVFWPMRQARIRLAKHARRDPAKRPSGPPRA